MINLENIRFIYPSGFKALNDVTLNIDDGEFLAIICPHCQAENIVSNEEKIQSVEDEKVSDE